MKKTVMFLLIFTIFFTANLQAMTQEEMFQESKRREFEGDVLTLLGEQAKALERIADSLDNIANKLEQ